MDNRTGVRMGTDGINVLKRVKEYLDSQEWKYTFENSVFQLSFDLENKLGKCDMHIYVMSHGESRFSIHTQTIYSQAIPLQKRNKIVELITRANYGTVDGFFSYQPPNKDSDEGTIYYSSRLYCHDLLPSLRDVESSVDFPLRQMMKYGDAIFNVLILDEDPQEEIQRVEGEI